MAERVMPRDALVEMTEVTNQDSLLTIWNADTDANDRIKKENFNVDGVRLSADRIESKELISGALNVTGWYTIAETEAGAILSNCAMGEITVLSTEGRGAGVKFGIKPNNTARTKLNTFIEFTNFCSTAVGLTVDVVGFRWAKSDTTEDSGAKLQMQIASSSTYNIQLFNHLGRINLSGLQLVDPYLDNTPTLPDGVTVGTFLEAGVELSFDTPVTHYFPDWIASKISNDQLRCAVAWPEIPKQGTNLVITLPSTTLSAKDGEGIGATISGSHTISNFSIDGKHVLFFLNETGVFTALNSGPIGLLVAGTGCKLTIT